MATARSISTNQEVGAYVAAGFAPGKPSGALNGAVARD
jgi:hypothetical protein